MLKSALLILALYTVVGWHITRQIPLLLMVFPASRFE